VTQIEIDMKQSLLLAELWKMLRETQLKMETQIVPLLSELDADPTGELSQTLNLAADAIEQHFRTHKLVAEKRKAERR
jgi:hypothetical protein